MDPTELARQGLNFLETTLSSGPPPGVSKEDISHFFQRHRSVIEDHLRGLLARILEPLSVRLDREYRGRWHLLSSQDLLGNLEEARQAARPATIDWLLSRLRVHRPDLFGVAEQWAKRAQVPLPAQQTSILQFVPIDDSGRLELYEVSAAETARLPKVIRRENFPRFAELAYLDDQADISTLLEISAGWFGRTIAHDALSDDADPTRYSQLHQAIAARSPGQPADQIEQAAREALATRRRLMRAAGLIPKPVLAARKQARPVDPENAPTPTEILEALREAPELRTPAERTAANLRAINVLLNPSSDQKANWRDLMAYSGWGALSLDAVADKVPEGWLPALNALIHEYYTPVLVALSIASVVLPLVPGLPRIEGGQVMALEPAAGIGRLVNAVSTPGFEMLTWSVVEYSHVSAALLQAMRPDLQVAKTSFEEWIQTHEGLILGKLGLVVSNPPYGERGATFTIDKSREYRENKAYVYFLRRCLDLLAAGGVGVFLIPYGFMTGRSPALMRLREKVLRRHHLRAAFRLPSNLFPGALLVTDLLFFEARGGELASILPDDLYISEGEYFIRNPTHILGKEVGTAGDEDDHTAKPRWGYQVEGTFQGLPEFEPRLRCATCHVTPLAAPKATRSKIAELKSFDELPLHVQVASVLGGRVRRYLDLLGAGDHDSLGRASALQPELFEALQSWAYNLGQARNPYGDSAVQLASKSRSEIVSFLAGYTEAGAVVPQITTRPVWQPKYEGRADDVLGQAEWLYSTKRALTLPSLLEFRASMGLDESITAEQLAPALVAGGWCFDDGNWLPARDYYSGLLWDRFDRARQAAHGGDTLAAAQLARLSELIQVSRIDDIDPTPRMPWIPVKVLVDWLEKWTNVALPEMLWRDGLFQAKDHRYDELSKQLRASQVIAVGYLNHDLEFFKPKYDRRVNADTGEEESAEQALDRVRLEYDLNAKRNFRDHILADTELTTTVEASYNRMFRGYIQPEYPSDEIPIARWQGKLKLHPHQNSGARRLIANNGGLLGFDVGVGKTYTGIATVARLRQEGRARRPIVLVPNTIIWKWYKDFKRVLPDFRVLVVGSNRYMGRQGVYASKIDSPEERALKWRQFQAGEFDVALVTYSVFSRSSVRPESLREWVYETPALLKKLALDSRELERRIAAGQDTEKKRKVRPSLKQLEKFIGAERLKQLSEHERAEAENQLVEQKEAERDAELNKLLAVVSKYESLSERGRAIFGESLDRWIAMRLDSFQAPDPGIYFEDLGCDCILVDEAQNFKNLWPVQQREGGVPKYLGAISEGSDRAYALAVRAHLVRRRNGGSGVFLLSATPAKNSPLEYFTLLGYVDAAAWSRVGITDPEVFIDRYLRLEQREIVSPDMSTKMRNVVAGFIQLDELRSIIFRFAEFRTAEEVGIKLPKSEVDQIVVPMDERQERKYSSYARQYADALKRSKDEPRLRMKALGLLQRMALVAIHPELDEGPRAESADSNPDEDDFPERSGGWTYKNAVQVTNPNCPKLDAVRRLVLMQPDCGHLIFCDNVAVHRWCVMLLIEAGFPESRIAVLNADQAKDPAKRQSIAERFNGTPEIKGEDGVLEQVGIAPEFDVVIANATAYEGIDLHVRTCMVYHIDLPWEPATLQQRNGRAVRQGNNRSVIGIRYLFSEKSLDVIRFDMIKGKLGWMKDLLASADRETNNPAAQAEMSADEMVLFLARDPEEAQRAMEEQKALLAREQQKRVREQAWSSLRGLVSRTAVVPRVIDPTDKAALLADITRLTERLAAIPATVWPWHFLIQVVKDGGQLLFGHDFALPAEWYVTVPHIEEKYATGSIDGDSIGVRQFGEPAFRAVHRDKLAGTTQVIADAIEQGPARWDLALDRELFVPKLEALIQGISVGEWEKLGLSSASPSWRQYLVETHWPRIVSAIQTAGKHFDFSLPTRTPEGAIALRDGDKIDLASLIPFDVSSFGAVFLKGAGGSGERWSDLNAASLAWWGKPFPRGLLPQQTKREIKIKTSDGSASVPALVIEGPLAVTYTFGQGPDTAEPRFSVIHVASGLAVTGKLLTEEVAVATLRYVNRQAVDWTKEKPDFSRLDPQFRSTLGWLAELRRAPTDDEIRQRDAS